jgi:large subunit ribosomal protein L7Ae
MPKKVNTTKPNTKPAVKKVEAKNPLFEKRPRNFGIGQALRPKRDLTRFVRWPKYIKLQRQRSILIKRLKVPPTIHQFTRTLDKSSATNLFKLLNKYKPETKLQKKQRLLKLAEAKTKGEKVAPTTKSNVVHYGLNEVTTLIEQKKAKLVAIAHDVDPIELVVWIPSLCKKAGIPYCIVKGKARLGAAVHQTTASVVALTSVDKEDLKDLTNLTDLFTQSFNNNADLRKTWGGGRLGGKAVAAQKKKERAVAREQSLKNKQA